MPDRIITAEAVISARDATGDTFINIARKLQQIGNGAKASAEVERLSAALSQAEATAKKIDSFKVASRTLDAAGVSMAQTRQKAAQLSEQIAGMTKPTATLNGQITQAERAVIKATDAFKKQGQAVREARSALAEAGVPLNRLGAEQKRLQEVVQSTTRALEAQIGVERQAAAMAEKVAAAARDQARAEVTASRIAHREAEQRDEAVRRNGVGHLVAGAAAGYVSAHGVYHLGSEVMGAGSELQRARLSSSQAGIPPAELAHIEQRALELSTHFGNVSQVGVMELAKELRSVVTHPEELDKVLTPLVQAKSVLDAKDLTGESSHGLNLLVKGAESIGAAQDPERLTRLIDAYVKAIQVMGSTINPDQIFQFDKYSKTAGATMSDRFLMTTGLSLSQEMGGSTAANDIFHAQKDIVGGFQNKHTPLREMVRLGLIDRDDVDFAKGSGEAKGIKPGHKGVHDAALAQTDLDLWVYNTLLPALEKNGIKDTQAQLAQVTKIFTGGEADVISKLITQRPAFENHALAFPKASGLAASGQNAEDAAVGLQSLGKAVENLAANVSVSAMAPIGTALTGLAGQIDRLAQAAKDHPDIALGAGVAAGAGALAISGTLAYYVSTGFGLPKAASQLEAAALHLQGAGTGPGGGTPGDPGKPGGSPGYASLAGRALLYAFNAFEMATNAPGLDEAGQQRREANSKAGDAAGQTLKDATGGWFGTDALRDQLFGKGRDATDAVSDWWRSGDRQARIVRSERPRLALDPLETGRDRLRDEMIGPPTASASHPDDDRATRARASDAASWLDELGRKERESVFTLGALDNAARTAAGSLLALASLQGGGGAGGGGSGIISAAYHPGGGGFGNGSAGGSGGGTSPLLRGAGLGGGSGGSNPYAGGSGAGAFVPPVGDHLTAGMRNNNLGNIGFFGQHMAGLIGPSNARDVDHSIARFDTQDSGIRAAAALALRKYRGGRHSAWDLIAAAGGWTPGKLGPGASVNVARAMGLGNRDDLHLDQPDQMVKFLHGLAVQEHGPAGRFYDADRIRGALGGEHPALAARPRRPVPHSDAPALSAHNELVGEVRKMTAAVERGGLHRVHVALDKGLSGKKTYSRGNVGATVA